MQGGNIKKEYFREELKERDDSKLTINSIVGKSGMEQYLDQVLQEK